MVGDGSRSPVVRSIVEEARLIDRVVFTGLVPQEEGPAHMAACDVLVAPHVPNPDGSAFFGSPTKLFEYLAMGRAVVASDLDQLGDVITDNVNGLLVPPGDPGRLAEAMARLALDAGLRGRLGHPGPPGRSRTSYLAPACRCDRGSLRGTAGEMTPPRRRWSWPERLGRRRPGP